MTKADKNKAWRDKQAGMLRDNLKKRKMFQKAQLANNKTEQEDRGQDS